MSQTPKKILIISRNWIGDAIGNTVAIKNIRLCFPDSYIAVLCPKRCRGVFRADPDVDEVIVWKRGHGRLWWCHLSWFLRLRKKHFDSVFLFHESRSRAVLSYLLGASNRIGFNGKKRARFLSVEIQEDLKKTHFVDRYCDLLRQVGVPVQHDRYIWDLHAHGKYWLQNYLTQNGINEYIVIHPAANREHRMWDPERFAQFADFCKKELKLDVIFSGRSSDRPIIEEITCLMKEPFFSSVGMTTLEYLLALIKDARFYVGVDTGASHLAAASGMPVIVLFGATEPSRVGPYHLNGGAIVQKEMQCRKMQCDLDCREQPRYRWMKEITVDDLMTKARDMIGKTQ